MHDNFRMNYTQLNIGTAQDNDVEPIASRLISQF